MGIDQGKNREKVDAALKGIAAGFSNDIIRIITGLSDEQIDELRK
jgi:hypothetical protein